MSTLTLRVAPYRFIHVQSKIRQSLHIVILAVLALFIPSALRAQYFADEPMVQVFGRAGVSLNSVEDAGIRSDYRATIDLIGDTRTIFPGALLVSVPFGLGSRGYKRYWSGSDNYLWARNVFLGLRPGIHLGYRYRLDVMAGIHVSYDLWGREYYNGKDFTLGNVNDYRRFDFGWNACASVVLNSFEIYFEYRKGLLTMFREHNVRSAVFSFGIGWDF